MKLYALKKPDKTFDHQTVAREAKWVWDKAATSVRMMGTKITDEDFKAEMEKGGYTVQQVNIVPAEKLHAITTACQALLKMCEDYLGPMLCGGEMTEARAALDISNYVTDPNEKDQPHCQRCGIDINEIDVKDNRGMCSECYDKMCDEVEQ